MPSYIYAVIHAIEPAPGETLAQAWERLNADGATDRGEAIYATGVLDASRLAADVTFDVEVIADSPNPRVASQTVLPVRSEEYVPRPELTTAEVLRLALDLYQPANAGSLADDHETETWLLIVRDQRDGETLGQLRHEAVDEDDDAELDDAEAWQAVTWVDLRTGTTYNASTAAYIKIIHTAGAASGVLTGEVKP